MNDYEYLSDEELELLINDVEATAMIEAPGGILDAVLESIADAGADQTTDKEKLQGKAVISELQRPPEHRISAKTEYRRYCMRVFAAAAAAIVLMNTVPALINTQRVQIEKLAENREERKENTEEGVFSRLGSSRRLSDVLDFGILSD